MSFLICTKRQSFASYILKNLIEIEHIKQNFRSLCKVEIYSNQQKIKVARHRQTTFP